MQQFSSKYSGTTGELFSGSDVGVRHRRLSNSAIFGIQAKTLDHIISQTQRRALHEKVRELGDGQDRDPTEVKRVEKLQGRSKEAYVVEVQEQRLPYINAVREHA